MPHKIDNPFIISERIIPKYFCDRKEETSRLISLIKNGHNAVLVSPRRMGKTALIRYCYEDPYIKKNYITVYVDILSTTNLQEFTYLLGREIFKAVSTRGEKFIRSFLNMVKSLAGKVSFDPVSYQPVLNLQLGDIRKPEFTLGEIFEYVATAPLRCVIAIDEFQQVSKYPEKNVEALLRSHLLQINNCRMIFSGSERHILAEMFSTASRPFYLSATFMELRPIPEDIYVDFIREMMKTGKREIEGQTAREVYEMFEGITFYVQMMCNGLYNEASPDTEVKREMIRNVLDNILASYDVIYRMQMSELTLRQKELLIAIAQEKIVEQMQSVSFIAKYSLSSASAVQTALKSLMKQELITHTEKGYMIDDRFFRYWILKNYVSFH